MSICWMTAMAHMMRWMKCRCWTEYVGNGWNFECPYGDRDVDVQIPKLGCKLKKTCDELESWWDVDVQTTNWRCKWTQRWYASTNTHIDMMNCMRGTISWQHWSLKYHMQHGWWSYATMRECHMHKESLSNLRNISGKTRRWYAYDAQIRPSYE